MNCTYVIRKFHFDFVILYPKNSLKCYEKIIYSYNRSTYLNYD